MYLIWIGILTQVRTTRNSSVHFSTLKKVHCAFINRIAWLWLIPCGMCFGGCIYLNAFWFGSFVLSNCSVAISLVALCEDWSCSIVLLQIANAISNLFLRCKIKSVFLLIHFCSFFDKNGILHWNKIKKRVWNIFSRILDKGQFLLFRSSTKLQV